jgi:sugar-specific transcriptional regulator TrmB
MELADLKKIGLTQGEIKIYSALLDLGESTRTQLAKKSGISPSKIYDVANRLLEKGVISSVKKNGVIHFIAANPKRLKDFLNQKQEEIENEKSVVDQMLPLLLSKYKSTKAETDVEVFYGWEGMKTVFNDLLNEVSKKDKNYIFGASKGKDLERTDTFFLNYFQKAEKNGYEINVIFNEDMRGWADRTGYFVKSRKHQLKFLHQKTFSEFNIYKDTVLFIMLLEKPIVIRIRNKEAADAAKKFFRTLWEQAKP